MNTPTIISLPEAHQIIQSQPESYVRGEALEHLEAFGEFVQEGDSQIVLYQGDTTLARLAVGSDIVLVNGNLSVEDTLEDCDGVDCSLLIVLGNVVARNLINYSQICITGNLTVHQVIIANSLCDYSLDVGGNLQAETILEHGQWFDVQGKVRADFIYAWHSSHARKGVLEANLSAEDLVDAIKDDGNLDTGKAIDYLMQGNSVFHKP